MEFAANQMNHTTREGSGRIFFLWLRHLLVLLQQQNHTKPYQTIPNHTKLYQTIPNHTKPNHTKLQIINYKLPLTNCHSKIANSKLPITSYRLQIANCQLLNDQKTFQSHLNSHTSLTP